METTRPSFWQLTSLSALLPFVGFWPVVFTAHELSQVAEAASSPVVAQEEARPVAQYLPLPQVRAFTVKKSIRLTVTAYSSTVDQTDGDPFTTASGAKVRDGIIAHNGLPFGTKVRFPDVFADKVFVVQDRLHPRKGYYIADLWMETREEAKQWGAPILNMEILEN